MKTFLLFITISFTVCSFGQTYTFSHFIAGYTNLSGSTSLNNGATWDDPIYTIPLGFTFNYFGESMTTIQLDGLGGMLIVGDYLTDPYESYLIAYGPDIIDRGDDLGTSLSNISYKTDGAPGGRVCKIEWNNVGFFDGNVGFDNIYIDYLNFQVWLYESSDVIEIRFGPKSITEPLVDFGGETGPGIVLLHGISTSSNDIYGHQLMLGGNPSNPTSYDNDYSLNDTVIVLDTVIPPLTVYRFNPALTTSQEEISSISPFSVVPNPAQDKLRLVRDENVSSEIHSASIVDVNGKVLFSNLEFNKEISIRNLHSGMYFIQVEMKSGERYSEKFTKL